MKFLESWPTKRKPFNIALASIFSVILLCLLAIILLISNKPNERSKSIVKDRPRVASNTNQDSPAPVSDIVMTQLKNKEIELQKSNQENEQLKAKLSTFAQTVDSNFTKMQRQMIEMSNRVDNLETTLNNTLQERNSLKIIRLDKLPYKEHDYSQPTPPHKGKVLAQVGNVIWVERDKEKNN